MPIHPTERDRNIIRTIMVGLSTVDLGGFTLLPDGDDRAPGDTVDAWVRVSVLPVSSETQGRSAPDTLDTRHDILVSCEVYQPTSALTGSSAVDSIEAPVEALKHYLTARQLEILDYVSEVEPPASTGHFLQFFMPPRRERMAPSDGYQRRMLTAEATYYSKHTG